MVGIYSFTNIINGKVYIGKSVDIIRRYNEHMDFSRYATQYEDEFHFLLNEHPENFIFQILEICNKEELNEKEAYYINYYNSIESGYNKIKASNNFYEDSCAAVPSKREIIKMITNLLEKPLFKEDKEKLARFFNYKGSKGQLLKWRTIKQIIIDKGFDVVESKRFFNGKTVNCSIIRLRWDE
jgi:group I intron endonuclease